MKAKPASSAGRPAQAVVRWPIEHGLYGSCANSRRRTLKPQHDALEANRSTLIEIPSCNLVLIRKYLDCRPSSILATHLSKSSAPLCSCRKHTIFHALFHATSHAPSRHPQWVTAPRSVISPCFSACSPVLTVLNACLIDHVLPAKNCMSRTPQAQQKRDRNAKDGKKEPNSQLKTNAQAMNKVRLALAFQTRPWDSTLITFFDISLSVAGTFKLEQKCATCMATFLQTTSKKVSLDLLPRHRF